MLAAGLSSRMGGAHKLLLDIGGQPGSVVTGARAVGAACDAVMIVLGDQPLLTQAGLLRLIGAYDGHPAGKSILVPLHGGAPGNPVVLAACHIAEIAEGRMKLGRGRLLEAYPDAAFGIEMGDDAFTRDCDTPADYAALTARISAVTRAP